MCGLKLIVAVLLSSRDKSIKHSDIVNYGTSVVYRTDNQFIVFFLKKS